MRKLICFVGALILFTLMPCNTDEALEINEEEIIAQVVEEIIAEESEIVMAEEVNFDDPEVIKDELEEDIKTKMIRKYNAELEEISDIEDKMEWYKAYRDIAARYSEWVPVKSILDEFTEEEFRLLCQLAETECYQRSMECKANVVSVALNRYYSGKFGKTLERVITKPHQFAYGRERITESSILAVLFVYDFGDTAQGALYFHSFKEAKPTFQDGEYIFSDQAVHHFYK